MRIGTMAYATYRGLGHLAHDFYTNGVLTDVCTILHGHVPDHSAEWYPGMPVISSLKDPMQREVMRAYCLAHDAMLFFETPFDWSLIPFCRLHGVKTFLVTMYECTHVTHEKPDCYICPSKLDCQYFPNVLGQQRSVLLPLPTEIPWKLRERAMHYVHNGGYLGLRGREGTTLLIEAMRYVRSPLKLTIRVQEHVGTEHRKIIDSDSRIEYIHGTFPREQLYSEGDVIVIPQKFNGCSLPLQESRASGMLVMTTDRFPTNDWLGTDGALIPTAGSQKARVGGAYLEFDEAIIDPKDIAFSIDAWYGSDISRRSQLGRVWAEQNTWGVLKPKWLEVLAS